MKTDYSEVWPGKFATTQERDDALRIGQLKYDLRQSQTTVRTLEWIVFIELIAIVALVMVCVS